MTALRLSSGSVEALKWLALVAMTGDHLDAFVYGRDIPALAALGRIAMPLFGLVLAYNLGRPGADLRRLAVKLVAFALLATAPHAYLTGHLLPLNILWSFAAACVVLAFAQVRTHLGDVAAAVAFAVAGLAVEYGWPGMAVVLAGVWYFRTGRPAAAGAVVLAIAGVSLYGSLWAFAALPLVWVASWQAPAIRRHPWAFWGYYPAHLAALAIMAT
jgi:hypothetical protein